MISIQVLLNSLTHSIDKLDIRAFFNVSATINQINHLQDVTKLTMPADFVDFYLTYNGGFFADKRWTESDLLDKTKFDNIQWNSNHFLTIDKIQDKFSYVEDVSNFADTIPTEHYLPFFQTEEQELFLLRLSKEESSKPVIKLIRQTSPEYWIRISKDFNGFLKDFIDKKGDILDYY